MGDCARCLHRDEHGWWGAVPSGRVNDRGETVMVTPSHCGSVNVAGVSHDGCHRDWTGVREAHCPSCHQHFSSNTAADHHDCSVDPGTHHYLDDEGEARLRFYQEDTYGGPVWKLLSADERPPNEG